MVLPTLLASKWLWFYCGCGLLPYRVSFIFLTLHLIWNTNTAENTKIKMSKTSRMIRTWSINYCGCGTFLPCKAKILASAISQLLEQDEKGLIYNVNQNIGRVDENRMKQGAPWIQGIMIIMWFALAWEMGFCQRGVRDLASQWVQGSSPTSMCSPKANLPSQFSVNRWIPLFGMPNFCLIFTLE